MDLLFSVGLHNVAIAAVLVILVWAVTRIWKNQAAAHLLWLLVLVKLVTPPFVNLDLEKWSSALDVSASKPTADPPAIALQPMIDDSHDVIPASTEFARSDKEQMPVPEGNRGAVPAASLAAIPPQPRMTIEAAWSAIRPVLMWMWGIGAGLVALVAGIRIVRFRRMLAGTLPASQWLQSVADDLATRMGLRRCPDVRLVESATAPFVWCLGPRATVVLPLRLLNALDEHQTAMVLAHELAHVRRRDHWVRVVELVVSALYWWNPGVCWVRRQLHTAEEQCCDAWVAWIYPDRSHEYADSLLRAAELVTSHSSSLVLLSPFLNTHSLKARVEKVLQNRSHRTTSGLAMICLSLAAAVVIPAGVTGARGQVGGASPKGAERSEALAAEKPVDVAVAVAAERTGEGASPSNDGAQTGTTLVQNDVKEQPVSKAALPFQGTWKFERYGSLKWPAELDEARTWRWTIRDQNVTWTRPGKETIALSLAVAPDFTKKSQVLRNPIELTVLDGADQGRKCLGIFYWEDDALWVCFQDPGANGERPKTMGFNGYAKQTMIQLKPVPLGSETQRIIKQPVPPIEENPTLKNGLHVFQGTWKFDACESVLWYINPRISLEEIRESWKWAIEGREMTWTRAGKDPVRMSIRVDPTKEPNQIDFTFLDGPDKGKTCQGIYEFERMNLWICMTEPGADVPRPEKMAMSGTSKTALIILNRTRKNRIVPAGKPNEAAPKPVQKAADPLSLLQGTFHLERWISERWPAKPDEFKKWQWTIRGQEVTWRRPGQEAVRLSFTIDASKPLPEIDLIFLDGPYKGEKCRGVYLASRHEVAICFQDPGADVNRPKYLGSDPGSHHTSIALTPVRTPPAAEEIEALSGQWKFEIYYSDWWPARISNPPFSKKAWRWSIKGNEIAWTGMAIDDVGLSFALDPSKSPKQIDLTFLDGPYKGKQLRGIYKFGFGGCDICVADPDANVDRPTDFGYSTNSGHTWLSMERVAGQ